ncbi:hypothetical protein JAGODDHD_03773 (plasmid) [Sphingomonas paucimobilis]|nr:hypothetical protein [Sphingomonas paucimobilis]
MIRTMRLIMPLALLLSALPVTAQNRQDRGQEQEAPMRSASPLPMTGQGETARSAVGQAGQRQSREQVAVDTGIEPMGRINRRIQNRVQSRIRNRIDRYYSPQANATSPFAVASEQAAGAGRSRR